MAVKLPHDSSVGYVPHKNVPFIAAGNEGLVVAGSTLTRNPFLLHGDVVHGIAVRPLVTLD